MKLFIISLLTFFSTIAQSQNLSLLPPIYNYSQTQYKAGMQNWQITQCEDGVLYVANNQRATYFSTDSMATALLATKENCAFGIRR